MEGGTALPDWLRARRPVEAHRALRHAPALTALADTLDRVALPSEGAGEWAVAAALEAAFGAIRLDDLMAEVTAHLRRDGLCDAPFAPIGDDARRGVILLEHPRAVVSLSVISVDALADERARSIVFSGTLSVSRFIRAGAAALRFWDDAEGECRPSAEPRMLADGDILVLDGRERAWAIERAAADIVVLRASVIPGRAALSREYDADSLTPLGVSSNDEAASRAQMMLSFLRLDARRDAASCFAALLEDRAHFLRWHAMREFLALDFAAALPHLRRMARLDPHEEVRDAAAATLATVESRFLARVGAG